MKSLGISIVALGVCGFVAPASAYPVIQVTACDTLGVDPLRVRTTFDLSWTGFGFEYGWFVVQPQVQEPVPPDSTHLYDCQAPPTWVCRAFGSDFSLEFSRTQAATSNSGIFSIVSDRAVPCVNIVFISNVLSRTPNFNDGGYFIQTCLSCDMPVPAARASWGSLKSRYR